jgi:hypothetical protein
MAPSHPLRKLSTMRPATATKPDLVADHRFSEQDLVDLVSALRARAASHPDNPGLVACWPAVPEHRMAAGCRLLARRGYPVQRVSVAGWEPGKTRNGWAIGIADAAPARAAETRDEQARSDAERCVSACRAKEPRTETARS